MTTVAEHEERLVSELHRLGVRHLTRLDRDDPPPQPLPAADLIAGLAASEDARLQAALILLFLRRPVLSLDVPAALDQLSGSPAAEVKLFYQAAVYLQGELAPTLRTSIPDWLPLPDLFSKELGLPIPGDDSIDAALIALGERHCQLTGWNCNWAGSYRQNIDRFVRRLQRDN